MLNLRINDKRVLANGIVAFELVNPDGSDLPQFTGGAHVELRVPNGLMRKYSLCNDPAERQRYVIAVKREATGRSGSLSLIDGTNTGDVLAVTPPQNNIAQDKSPAGFILIAGGIGITPIMAMMRELRANDGKFKLYYCTRAPEFIAFRDELLAPELRGSVAIHHDGGDPARTLDLWPILERPKGQHVYCCGPTPLMQAVRDMTGHWSASAVHFEAFREPDRVKPDDKPFRVYLAKSGGVVDVPVGTTILEALRAHGLTVPSSCESGTCGSCRTRLIAGEADHRDLVLADGERSDNIMVCVSRALSGEISIDR